MKRKNLQDISIKLLNKINIKKFKISNVLSFDKAKKKVSKIYAKYQLNQEKEKLELRKLINFEKKRPFRRKKTTS